MNVEKLNDLDLVLEYLNEGINFSEYYARHNIEISSYYIKKADALRKIKKFLVEHNNNERNSSNQP